MISILNRSNFFLLLIIFLLPIRQLFATDNDSVTRQIDISGMVVNAADLSPIESAAVFDLSSNVIATTDKNGFFNIRIGYSKAGGIKFKLKIKKTGYNTFLQNENWGDLPGTTKSIMYFGLKGSKSKAEQFSLLDNSFKNNDNSYGSVLNDFYKLRTKKEFDDKLANAKAGNQNIFIKIDAKFYITDTNGWIQLNSERDTVMVNNKQAYPANMLNNLFKRKAIKSMTPLNLKGTRFAIYLRN